MLNNNQLHFGDCLRVLKDLSAQHPQGFVDLIYLDPPFNSKRDYNLLFKSPKGGESNAQITAFEDSWHWGMQAETEFDELLSQPNTDVAEMMRALRAFLGENDLMAYLTMMANRLLVMHRVLKVTGSLYLHCDPTASHYLKVVLDGIFGAINFRNEIIWRRTGAHNSSRRYGPIHDVVLFYSKTERHTWNKIYRPYLQGHVDTYFKKSDERGRYWSNALTGAGIRRKASGKPWRGYDPTSFGRHWAIPGSLAAELGIENLELHEKLEKMYEEGCINLPAGSGLPEYRQYLHLSKGVLLQDVWSYQPHTSGTLYDTDECIDEDVRWIGKRGDPERLGYPTQKPLGLLSRMILSSTNEGELVLDPFCGCGTAVHAAQKLNRKWIGIDITHLAISLIESRLNDAFPGIKYEVFGTPTDYEGSADLARRDKYQFQWWALSLVKAQPYQGKKKGADGGIDGLIFFRDDAKSVKSIVVSVKGGGHVTRNMIGDLIAVVGRQKASIGLFVTLTPPTRKMVEEAAAAGFYESPHHGKFPKIQILTIEGLMNGTERPQYMDLSTGITFKQAKREIKIDAEQDELFDSSVNS